MLKKGLRGILLSLSFVFVAVVLCTQYVVTGGSDSPMRATQDSGDPAKRLEVYLVYGMDNVTISYTSSSSSSHQWYRHKTKRLEVEKMASTQNGTTSIIRSVKEGYGYLVGERTASCYVQTVDYSKYTLNISNLYVSDNSDPCSRLVLAGTDTIQSIYYYWSNAGTRRESSHQLDIIYNTLEYNSDKKEYTSKRETTAVEGDLFGKSIPAPWRDTEVCVEGDYFVYRFGKEAALRIDKYQAAVIDAHIDTLLTEQEAPNISTTKNGYCTPATVQFSAIANTSTAALFNQKIYRQGEEDDPVVRFTGEEVGYTFNQSGTFIIKLEVSDQSAACSTEDKVQVDTSESYLMIPNALSLGTTPRTNGEFRAAYKLLVKFKAWIFNRWGLQTYYWTDPVQGWDDKKDGKYVQPGIYFYVIEAEGSDGIKYKEEGGIGILGSKTIQDENENIQE